MTAQEYIQSKLEDLQNTLGLEKLANREQLAETILKLLLSKKFRKYSVTPEYMKHVHNAVKENIQNNRPINLTFLGGSYKLWRLEEAPESDWAELFACMYYIRWLKPICEVYAPGVWFDFFLDDLIVPRINNIAQDDVDTYRTSRQRIIDFLQTYMPVNMSMTLTGVGDRFTSRQAYEESLERNIKKLSETLPGGLSVLSPAQIATADLNVKVTPEQQKDPKWREKVELVHSAYMLTKAETGYSSRPDKIRVFTQPLASGNTLSVGSTKDSIVKFWVGVGALRPADGSYRQIVLSPTQLQNSKFKIEPVSIPNLIGKNFHALRVLQQ